VGENFVLKSKVISKIYQNQVWWFRFFKVNKVNSHFEVLSEVLYRL